MSEPESAARPTFAGFYRGEYADEHKHPVNRALHMLGTMAGLCWLAASATVLSPWWALAFPLVHAAPGLVGHRLFDRNLERGDLRVFSGSTPNWWFMVANHLMTFETLSGYRLRF